VRKLSGGEAVGSRSLEVMGARKNRAHEGLLSCVSRARLVLSCAHYFHARVRYGLGFGGRGRKKGRDCSQLIELSVFAQLAWSRKEPNGNKH